MLYAGLFFYEPVGRLHGLNQMLQSARAAAARVFDILDMPEERADRRAALREPVRGEVVYENVGFCYSSEAPGLRPMPSPDDAIARDGRGDGDGAEPGEPGSLGKAVLQGIQLHVCPGEMVALVGPTGAGNPRSSISCPHFTKPPSGRILIDGQDIGGISLDIPP